MTRVLVALLAVFAAAAGAAHADLTPSELRGRQIYRTGESASGTPIVALVGAENLEVPATALPCASCHGRDGRGKEEGGIRPSNLQWHALTKPYGTRPPYTPALLKRAITMGTSSAKQRLNPVMPRYRLSLRDADDLVAYLARVGTDPDPGLTDDTIVVGTALPKTPEAKTIRDALTTHFAAVNERGGLYGRRIRLIDVDTTKEEPFALIAAREIATNEIPTLAIFSPDTDTPNPWLIPLLPTLEAQCLALIHSQNTKVRIIHNATTAALAARLAAHHDPSSPTVLLLTPATRPLPTAHTLLVPAPFTTDAIFTSSPSPKILVALPTPRTSRDTALAAASRVTQALENAGRDVDRETLLPLLNSRQKPECTILQAEGGRLLRR
jgi:Cytochrome c